MKRNLLPILTAFLLIFGVFLVQAIILEEESIVQDNNYLPLREMRDDLFNLESTDAFYTSREQLIGTGYSGYIIEFEKPSIIEKRGELEGIAKTNNESLLVSTLTKIPIIEEFFVTYDNLEPRVQRYERELDAENQKIKNEIFSKVPSITGNAISEPEEKILDEFSLVFNGIALNVSDEEAMQIEKIKGIKKAWPNYKVEALLSESVPLIQERVPAGKLDIDGDNCEKTGEECLTGKEIKIAIIDTGVDYTHPDLGGCFGSECKVIGGYDIINNDADPMDDHGHGTHVAATAAGNGVLKGVAPDAQILAYKVLDSGGSGTWESVIGGIEKAVEDGVNIISMSLGGYGNPDDPVSQAVDNAVDAGIVAVIAAGNSGPGEETIGSPGTARKAITVGATDKYDNLAGFSSRGPVIWDDELGIKKTMTLIKPDIVAPGVEICAAQASNNWLSERECLDSQHIAISGTSMATPHVAGAAALIKQKHPDWIPEEIKATLKGTAKDLGLFTTEQGTGRINVREAIKLDEKPLIAILNVESYEVSNLIDITGTAKGETFDRYEVYYSKKSDINWNLICSGERPIDDGILCYDFDTSYLDQGDYVFELRVYNNIGQLFKDYDIVKFNNFGILLAEKTGGYFGGGNKVIKGETKLSDYESYKVEYFDERDANWKEICGKLGKIENNVLCSVSFDEFENKKYLVRLSLLRDKEWIHSDIFEIAVIRELADNWPIKLECYGDSFITSEKIDGINKIFTLEPASCGPGWFSSYSRINIYDSNSNSEVIDSLYKDGGFISPVVGYYSPSIIDENLAFPEDYGDIGIFDMNGNFIDDWPYYTESFTRSHFIISKNRLFNLRDEWLGDYSELYIYGFERNGSLLNNFPIKIEKENGFSKIGNVDMVLINSIDKDYLGVLVTLSNGWPDLNTKLFFDIYSISNGERINRTLLYDGSDKMSWPYYLSLASGDFNKDGNSESAVGYGILNLDKFYNDIYDPLAYQSYLKIIDSKGNIITEPYQIDGYLLKEVRVGNFNRDNLGIETLNIIFSLEDTWSTTYNGQRIIGMDYKGNIMFDNNLDYNKIIGGISIGDVTGDENQDILVSHRPRWWGGESSEILIYNQNGKFEKEIIIPTLGEVEYLGYGADPTLVDFDGDGDTEIILKTLHLPKGLKGAWQSNIFVFETNAPYNEDLMGWPQFQHDSQHTGCYDCDKDTGQAPISLSKIENLGNNEVSINLSIKIQKFEEGSWTDYREVINENHFIPAKGILNVAKLFNDKDIAIYQPGRYRLNVTAIDSSGAVIADFEEGFFVLSEANENPKLRD